MKKFNLDEYLKNPTKRVVTRDGRPVKIICTNFNSFKYSIIAEIEGTGYSESFTKSGECIIGSNSQKDLFFAQEKHIGWVNIYKSKYDGYELSQVYQRKEDAETEKYINDSDVYITTTKIKWEE